MPAGLIRPVIQTPDTPGCNFLVDETSNQGVHEYVRQKEK